MKTTRTMYSVRPLSSEVTKAIMVVREGKTIVEVTDYGRVDTRDAVAIISKFSGIEIKTGSYPYSTTEFRKLVGTVWAKTIDLKRVASGDDSPLIGSASRFTDG